MAKIEMARIETQLDHRLLFNVRVYAAEGRMDLPIGIVDAGSDALDQAAVLRSTLQFAEDLAATARALLGAAPQT